jgi:hypothetical protein
MAGHAPQGAHQAHSRIEIHRQAGQRVLAGQYHSVFKGRGMAFSRCAQYQPGDEVRTIDWNVTARMNDRREGLHRGARADGDAARRRRPRRRERVVSPKKGGTAWSPRPAARQGHGPRPRPRGGRRDLSRGEISAGDSTSTRVLDLAIKNNDRVGLRSGATARAPRSRAGTRATPRRRARATGRAKRTPSRAGTRCASRRGSSRRGRRSATGC